MFKNDQFRDDFEDIDTCSDACSWVGKLCN